MQVKLHLNVQSALKAVGLATFKNYNIIDENFIQTNHFNPVIEHNTPIAIGITILELVSIFFLLS
jgi:hypothetical protein